MLNIFQEQKLILTSIVSYEGNNFERLILLGFTQLKNRIKTNSLQLAKNN
jgi:hypothetical protein